MAPAYPQPSLREQIRHGDKSLTGRQPEYLSSRPAGGDDFLLGMWHHGFPRGGSADQEWSAVFLLLVLKDGEKLGFDQVAQGAHGR